LAVNFTKKEKKGKIFGTSWNPTYEILLVLLNQGCHLSLWRLCVLLLYPKFFWLWKSCGTWAKVSFWLGYTF